MNKIKALVLAITLLAFSPHPSPAATLLSEGFETYNLGGLDANYPGPNTGPNGGPGTAWWSLNSPSFFVVNAESYPISGVSTNLVSPHSGAKMIRGHTPPGQAFDTIFYNLAYRLNNTNGFSGDFSLNWWFYDPLGTNSAGINYTDAIRLGAYPNVSTDADYFGAPDDPGVPTQWLSLGAASIQGAGYKATNYQVQVFGAPGGYNAGQGWFNLTNRIRSVGWHHARIDVSPADTNSNTAAVAFYLDNMTAAAFTNITATADGFNIIEMDADYGNYTGYFDDLTFGGLPPPALGITAAAGKAVVTWTGTAFTLQTSTNLAGSNFVDVPSATSPYTNTIGSTPLFFRLKQ